MWECERDVQGALDLVGVVIAAGESFLCDFLVQKEKASLRAKAARHSAFYVAMPIGSCDGHQGLLGCFWLFAMLWLCADRDRFIQVRQGVYSHAPRQGRRSRGKGHLHALTSPLTLL